MPDYTCPKCGKHDFKISVTFIGTVCVVFQDDEDMDVYDSEPTDSSWDDDSSVYCFNCGWEGTMANAKTPTTPKLIVKK